MRTRTLLFVLLSSLMLGEVTSTVIAQDYRVETDLLGEKKVPADSYYGAQAARAMENFSCLLNISVTESTRLLSLVLTTGYPPRARKINPKGDLNNWLFPKNLVDVIPKTDRAMMPRKKSIAAV